MSRLIDKYKKYIILFLKKTVVDFLNLPEVGVFIGNSIEGFIWMEGFVV